MIREACGVKAEGAVVMDLWKRLGALIARHMIVVMPCCLALGIFFPEWFVPLRPLVEPMFMVMAFQGALGNSFVRVRETFSHPLPLVLILLFSHVGMPLVAWAVGHVLFGASTAIVSGLTLEYSVPVATSSILWISLYDGDISLGLSAVLISALISPITIPLAMQLLVGASIQVDVLGMMRELVVLVAVPAVVGTTLNDATHGWGSRVLSPALAPLARILLVLIVIANTTGISSLMRHLTPALVGVLVFSGAFCAAGYLMGLLLAHVTHQPRDRFVSVTFASAMKNISAGAVIATSSLPADALFPVMAGTLFQQVLAAVFGSGMGRVLEVDESAAATVCIPVGPHQESLEEGGSQ